MSLKQYRLTGPVSHHCNVECGIDVDFRFVLLGDDLRAGGLPEAR